MDSKLDTTKRGLESISGSAREAQMCTIKRMKFTEPWSFIKKKYEQQFLKTQRTVKEAISEAKEAMQANKHDTCRAKLHKGIELILFLYHTAPSTGGKP